MPDRAGALAVLAVALGGALVQVAAHADDPALAIRITSPTGRTGFTGAVRIVAQLKAGATTGPVRFFVDGKLLEEDRDGPPYAVEWLDENPFERRELAVEAADAAGRTARDQVVLEPFDVVEEAQVTSVLLDVSVHDRSGAAIGGLAPEAFALAEDGVPQQLDGVLRESVDATFALLVDASGSMSRRMDFVRRTAATLAGFLRPRDRMIVAPFARALRAATGPTRDLPTIVGAIDAIAPEGGTAILDSLVSLAHTVANAEGRRAIVLITDGYDEHSTLSFQAALEEVKKAGVTVYVVGIGGVAGISMKGERLLRQIATATGGMCFFPAVDQQLAGAHDALTRDIQNRYLVSYTPSNQAIDGGWRSVSLKTGNPDYVVRTRPGYFAPRPPPVRGTIEFTAVDRAGQYLNVQADDIELKEDGAEQHVETFNEASQPLSIVLALDASGSMRGAEADVISSARGFVDALRPEDALGLALFADQSKLTHDLSTGRRDIAASIDAYTTRGGTALFDAVVESATRLQSAEGRRVVVVMTDGRDENGPGNGPGSIHSSEDVAERLRASGATVFAIGLGAKVDRDALQRMADVSGGLAFFPANAAELHAGYARVLEALRRRYVVAYTSSNSRRDGKWRQVQIALKSAPDAAIRSAGGFFPPER
jgi:Ca-activated chloride channel homolog